MEASWRLHDAMLHQLTPRREHEFATICAPWAYSICVAVMNDGPIQIAEQRLNQALARLDQSLSTLESTLDQHLAEPPPTDTALVARHEALKTEVAAVIAELDDMVGAAPGKLAATERAADHG